MCIYFIDTFNELKVLNKCKFWWGGSLNERNSTNVPLGRASCSLTWGLCFYICVYIYIYILIDWFFFFFVLFMFAHNIVNFETWFS